MGDAKCPKCLGRLERLRFQTSQVECVDCRQRWSSDEDCRRVAWYEPRDRLPTPDERQALEAKHGPRAGWMARVKGDESFHPIRGSRVWDERGGDADGWAQWYWLNAGSVESYPHVDGRPVGWP